jgi:hypothetical protein
MPSGKTVNWADGWNELNSEFKIKNDELKKQKTRDALKKKVNKVCKVHKEENKYEFTDSVYKKKIVREHKQVKKVRELLGNLKIVNDEIG